MEYSTSARRKYISDGLYVMEKFPVVMYSTEEADERKVEYAHWSSWRGEEYIRTDDDRVLPVLSFRSMWNAKLKRNAMRFVVPQAQLIVNPYTKQILYRKQREQRDKTIKRKGIFNNRVKIAIGLYVRMFLRARGINWFTIADVLYPNAEHRAIYTRFFFRRQEVREMIKREVADALLGENLDPKRIAQEYNALINMCKEKKDRENFRLTLERLADLMDMMPEKRSVNMSIGATIGPNEIPESVLKLINQADEEATDALRLPEGTATVMPDEPKVSP